jgi:enoyl-CoA hydratase/carnithine racemase
MSYSIDARWHDSVAVVTFSDPARGNQICWAAVDELGDTLKTCRESGAKVLVLASGLQGHWLEHAWLQDLLHGVRREKQTGGGAGWFVVQEELAHEGVVSIAAISGNASGGGAELGWACDIRVAELQAQFRQPEVDMGLTTGIGGCSRLARLAGRATAADMVLTGSPVTAQRLHDLGAISRLVPEGRAMDSALELARELAGKSPAALAGLKRILAQVTDMPLAEALQHEQTVFQSVVTTDEAVSGMQAVQSGYDRDPD